MPSDPTLYLYTSLTAGSSHIITATSRIETILKANKIPFKAVDCATDEKARMLWTRRSKGRKIPGLVKFNDVIADLDQVEEWNEYGELEDQIEDQIDIFGDVPISATIAEAQAAAAARQQAQEEAKRAASTSTGRTASETRHISISDPKDEVQKKDEKSNPAAGLEKKDSPLSMAMRQAGAEAAAKAGQKKASPAPSDAQKAKDEETKAAMPPPDVLASATQPKLDTDVEEPTLVETGAKTPSQLASEGAARTSLDKVRTTPDESATPTSGMSTTEQIIGQRRKSSVPHTPSALAETTSIDEAHTLAPTSEEAETKASSKEAEPSTFHESSKPAQSTDESPVDKPEQEAASVKEDKKDAEEEEEEDDEATEPANKVAKVSATSKEEEKVLPKTKTEDQDAKEAEQAGASVGD